MTGTVVGNVVFLEEMGIASGHDGITRQETGVTVIGMESVPLPGIMSQYNIGLKASNVVGNRTAQFASVAQIPVDLMHKDHFAAGPQTTSRLALFDLSQGDEGRGVGVGVPGALGPVRQHQVMNDRS